MADSAAIEWPSDAPISDGVNRKYTINELNLVAADDVPALTVRFPLARPSPILRGALRDYASPYPRPTGPAGDL
jgi:hypothetical protein